jgi:hypothetical protein
MRLAKDENWDEWQTWDNGEGEFKLRAAHPKTNTVIVTAQLFYQAPPLWTVEATMEMDPGAFAQIAAEVTARPLPDHLGANDGTYVQNRTGLASYMTALSSACLAGR